MPNQLSENFLNSVLNRKRNKVQVYSDSIVYAGLGARVTCSGKVVFQYRFSFNGKKDRIDLGSYPSLTLDDARRKRTELGKGLALGKNPRYSFKEERTKSLHDETYLLRELFETWQKNRLPKLTKVYGKNMKRRMEINVVEKIGDIPVSKLTRKFWLDFINAKAITHVDTGKSMFSQMRMMYKFAKKYELVEDDPFTGLSSEDFNFVNSNKDERVKSLNDLEIHYFLQAIKNNRMSLKNKMVLKLCLLWGCRNGELRYSERADFNFKNNIWVIPPQKHKIGVIKKERKKTENGPIYRPIIPEFKMLIEEAIALDLHDTFLFPPREKGMKNITNRKRMPRDLDIKNKQQFNYNTCIDSVNKYVKKNFDYDMPKWSAHTLRKTFRTYIGRFAEFVVCEKALGHKLDPIHEIYDGGQYLVKMAEMYKKWWDKVEYLSNPNNHDEIKKSNQGICQGLGEYDNNWMSEYEVMMSAA